jgi:hypothetical protein
MHNAVTTVIFGCFFPLLTTEKIHDAAFIGDTITVLSLSKYSVQTPNFSFFFSLSLSSLGGHYITKERKGTASSMVEINLLYLYFFCLFFFPYWLQKKYTMLLLLVTPLLFYRCQNILYRHQISDFILQRRYLVNYTFKLSMYIAHTVPGRYTLKPLSLVTDIVLGKKEYL